MRVPGRKSDSGAEGEEPVYARDAELVKACLAGDNRAWTTLIERYHALVFSIPRQYGLGADDAADVYQAVCLALWKGLPSLRSEKALTNWIRITTRRQSERLAGRRRRESGEDEQALRHHADRTPGILENLARSEEEHRLRQAVQRLSARCADLLTGLYLVDPPMSYEDASQRFGLPLGSIGPTRARCLEKLRSLLAGH